MKHFKLALFLSSSIALAFFSGIIGCAGKVDGTTSSFPASCDEIRENSLDLGETPSNGTYTLYVGNDESKPWTVYCHNMSRSEPSEYLTVDATENYSEIGNGTVMAITNYRRIRIDPIRLEFYPLDDTFADSNFDDFNPTLPNGIEFIPLAWAEMQPTTFLMSHPGYMASVNLTGSPFRFSDNIEDMGYFCMFTNTLADENEYSGTGVSIATDRKSFSLTAIHLASQMIETNYTREVADCDNLNAADIDNIDSAVIPLDYVGE